MLQGTLKAFQMYFRKKHIAYNRVFDKQSPFTQEVLLDLAKFCRAHDTTFNPDPRVHALLEGRKEVWLRIQEQLELSTEEIYNLHVARNTGE